MTHETWLITGAAGFIGSNVAEHLLKQGHTVVGVDNLSSGDINNVNGFQQNPNWHWHELDILDDKVDALFYEHAFTHVLHLAAVVSVQVCEEDPKLAVAVNEHGFEKIAQLVLEKHTPKLIYASSSAVYGATETLPIPEVTPLMPLSLYGRTKVSNEEHAQAMFGTTSFSCIGMRFFNLFGPRQGAHSGYAAVIPKWVDALQHDKTPIIFGEGTATRDFCHINNVITAIECAARKELPGHHVFNIGNGEATSLEDLYNLISDILDKDIEAEHKPWRDTDILHSCADISLAKRTLGYEPVITLEDGLKRLLAP